MIRFKENKFKIFHYFFRAFALYEEDTPVDKEVEERYRQTLNEYKKKLIIDDKTYPDPFTLPKADFNGESQNGIINWPPIYYMDIAKYLKHINIPGDLLHRLEYDYKEGKGYRLFRCDFVKEIFWSAISKDSPVCIFKCKVTPSQRTSSSPYNVWAMLQKKKPWGRN